MKTKQLRQQRRLLGGESAVEGDRTHYPVGEPLTSAGTGKLLPWCLQWRLSFVDPAPALIPLLGGSRSRLTRWQLEHYYYFFIFSLFIFSLFLFSFYYYYLFVCPSVPYIDRSSSSSTTHGVQQKMRAVSCCPLT